MIHIFDNLKTVYAIPAYGRHYNSVEEIQDDWNNGKDFKLTYGPYFSNRDIDHFKNLGYESIEITDIWGTKKQVTIPLE